MFRLLIALGVAYMLLPKQVQQIGDPAAEPLQISAGDTLSAVQSVYNDVAGFCDRNPETCVTGAAIISELESKARAGLASLGEKNSAGTVETPDEVKTGSVQ